MKSNEFGKALKNIRQYNKYTLRALSKETGINISNLSRIEKGDICVTLDTADKILQSFGYCLYIQRLDEE